MLRKLSPLALLTILTVPMSLFACGDDDDDDGTSKGGTAGSTSTGGKGGSAGSAGSAGTGASGGTAGAVEGGATGEAGAPGGAAGMPGGAGGGGGGPGTCDLSGEGLTRTDLPSDITADLVLENDVVHVINGDVWVHDGVTLTIPPCTRLEGKKEPKPGILFALQGGRIVAEGTADEPILFTSEKPVGQRAAGDWGGVVLLGRAPITKANSARSAIYEGLTEAEYTYGGTVANDDSGSLKYVRIEFSGFEIAPDKEVNGLSMAGVGTGTTLDHIMVNNTLDDCFEWWGGGVRGTYLIANNCGDDYFDGDEGWVGGADYLVGRRDQDALDSNDPNGFELDSIVDGSTPETAFSFSHATLCGTGQDATGPNPQLGMMLRELVTGSFDSLALTGFQYGINTRDAFAAANVTIENSVFWSLTALGSPDTTDDDSGFDDESIFTNDVSNEFNPTAPPYTNAQCLADAGPAQAVLDSKIGAFPDTATVEAWNLEGLWVDWSEN